MLTPDILKYLLCLTANILIARFDKTSGHSSHWVGAGVGLAEAVVCFGLGSVVVLVLPTLITWVLLVSVPRRWVGRVGATVLSLYLLYHHWNRDDASWVLDYSGPLMMLTLRLIGLCFDWGDYKIKVINVLWLFGFAYWYPTFLTGPPLRYMDYMYAVYLRCPPKSVTGGVVQVVVAAAMYLGLTTLAAVPNAWVIVATGVTTARAKYYVGWTLTEMAAAMYGYDLVISDVAKVELSVYIRDVMAGWNIGTAHWFKVYVYSRLGGSSTIRTLITTATSGLWHGFHVGNIISFTSAGVMVLISREVYRAKPTPPTQVLIGIWTHLVINYIMLSFVILDVRELLRVYAQTYYLGFILMILGYVLTIRGIKTVVANQ